MAMGIVPVAMPIAMVTAMSIALVAILLLLGKDMRRRLKAERDLADALAFRKAMEDSLVTGLRARELGGPAGATPVPAMVLPQQGQREGGLQPIMV